MCLEDTPERAEGNGLEPVFAARELANFQHIARAFRPSPGEVSSLPGLDVHCEYMPLRGVVGGDHLINVDFEQRYDLDRRIADAERQGLDEVARRLRDCRRHAGILLADVAGHHMTDGLVGAMLHQAFLLGVHYELERYGRITTKLFELLNQRFFQTTGIRKYLTLVYAEISDRGKARIISAGHPPPFVYTSSTRSFDRIDPGRMLTFPPIGMFPSYSDLSDRVHRSVKGYDRDYTGTNELDLLAEGDALLLYSDGLSEHGAGYFPDGVEQVLRASPGASAVELCRRIRDDVLACAEPTDDISFVLVKRSVRGSSPA